jgi:hypothetical protein
MPRRHDFGHVHDPVILDSVKAHILITHVLDVLNATGLTADQAKDLLRHLEVSVEFGQRVPSKTPH